jgi:hypothetical protein
MISPFPKVRIRGYLTDNGARITLLRVKAPPGVRIRVRCWGEACPQPRFARAARRTRLRTFEGYLEAGTRLRVTVTRDGWIGKHTVIRIRRGKAPARRDRCVLPGATTPIPCPTP